MSFDGIIFLLILALIAYFFYWNKKKAQLAFIEKYRFSSSIGKKVQKKYPHLTQDQIDLVIKGLRDYFYICNKAKRRMVAMPSQVVDVAWHEFILFTRPYQAFCKKALGRFLHHTPTEAMRTATLAQDGIKRAWRLACAKSNINPSTPTRLPLLFSIDSLLGIEDGFKYSLDCKDKSSPFYGDGYCAGHIGCASGCAGDSGAPSSSSGFSDGCGGDTSGCGGGCGGD
ncbi:hypothetical protein Q8A57_03140 [Porticoccus litoralis]|uniref:Uncharacterized protein n=1 Tax=Porticoccus litoralis TaxID=434086 RepID=A0AAW8B2F3_9GAMM|nr:hypothetical protein [Porticoccus litoralis]MDP1519954.1 hypothetical protein [Porticoccus litoralis]